ncbi:DUF6082 family protein [Nonomuraea sp. CA-141351]|uniref:DUF6082 family protein n=1 Tax=Nonomuraea sp. CA-141351 TaxID=3239996 RepID=UPI003D8A9122
MKQWARHTTITLALLVATFCVGLVLLASPVFLRDFTMLVPANDWELLSNIGQAYGPAATILTALSLIGIAYSAIMQARSVRVASQQTWRMLHLEMIRLTLDDPALIQADGSAWSGAQDDFMTRLTLTANAWTSQWYAMYALGMIRDEEMRHVASYYFKGELGREHWKATSKHYRANAYSRRNRTFCRIMDKELEESVHIPARPIVRPRKAPAPNRTFVAFSAGAALALGIATYWKRRS